MTSQKIGFGTATALVIANMIGTGVFTSLGFQVKGLPSGPLLIFLWFCGGVLALCGGLSYIQLAKRYPGSGGEYHYIKAAYHPVFSYFTGIISVFAGFAAPVALATMALSSYLSQVFPKIPLKISSLGIITLITLIHCFSIHLSKRFQFISTAVKLLLILLFIGYGLSSSAAGTSFLFHADDLKLITSQGFATSLIYVSFAYSGWNACVYIFNEIKDPERNIKKAILTGTIMVTIIYMLLNYVFLRTVPIKELENVIEVGARSATAIFGYSGGKIMAGVISLLLISSISAMVWTGSRVVSKMASELLPAKSTLTNQEIPLIPILVQFLITVVLIMTNSFGKILMYTSILLMFTSCLAVGTLFKRSNQAKIIHLVPAVIFILLNAYAIVVVMGS
ncbi:APC family permease [Pedobacter metabolipauper]|uniref:Amino acid/polyamine/organocation transporter (APC superfamily) n=1 Tax=Pedobacter metabolipauper TaxID=425513 RepID=A0A4R6T3U1_9SPHI|nr:amino acid permease [Pedobacter metabolipauper]TDQ12041.1 amino acid/polyamine/organocation transporter (APC superfamily) [Pedobacter metabolipauper]